jgi:hypothetical protein
MTVSIVPMWICSVYIEGELGRVNDVFPDPSVAKSELLCLEKRPSPSYLVTDLRSQAKNHGVAYTFR